MISFSKDIHILADLTCKINTFHKFYTNKPLQENLQTRIPQRVVDFQP